MSKPTKCDKYKNGDIVAYYNNHGEIRYGTVLAQKKCAGGKIMYCIRIDRTANVLRFAEDIAGKVDKQDIWRKKKDIGSKKED